MRPIASLAEAREHVTFIRPPPTYTRPSLLVVDEVGILPFGPSRCRCSWRWCLTALRVLRDCACLEHGDAGVASHRSAEGRAGASRGA